MNLKVVKYCCKLEIRKKNTVLHKYGFSLEMLFKRYFLFTDKNESHNKIITLKTEEEQKQNTELFTNHFFFATVFLTKV